MAITALSGMAGISRKHLFAIIMGAPVGADHCVLLTPPIRQIESDKIAFRGTGR